MPENCIDIRDLHVCFHTYAGRVQAVRGVSFTIGEGEILALVGESGCGKSVTAQTIMRLNPTPPAEVESGEVLFEGEDVLRMSERQLRQMRGGRIGMIFQDPMTSLDPTKRIGYQMEEALRRHARVTSAEACRRALDMLQKVGIASPEQRMKQYPHEFSGGMRQRAMIAGALVCGPHLLIADEPTTALDVTIQAQILDLLQQLRSDLGTSILLITHDMGVVADTADRVAVMYAGLIVECGTVRELFYEPRHPYTWGLLASIPRPDGSGGRLEPIEGTPPDLIAPPAGCPFADRCRWAMKVCRERMPDTTVLSATHSTRCWLQHPLAPHVKNPVTEVN